MCGSPSVRAVVTTVAAGIAAKDAGTDGDACDPVVAVGIELVGLAAPGRAVHPASANSGTTIKSRKRE